MMSHSNNHFQHIILSYIDSDQRSHYLSHSHQMLQEEMKRRLEEVPEDERTLELKDRIFVEAPSEETIRKIRDELRIEFDDKIFYLEAQLHQMRVQMASGCFALNPVGTPHSVPSSSGQIPDASSAHQTHALENERFTHMPDEISCRR
uniref:Uncharacterized protein LOC105056192 isoform X2 n=1 Tax=Elaeis guineensis var. tenera TaxID=51953 RepID=A0A8N4FCR1_ELAGV|nr:uncharacterized protein LOC105056192 isoform X2 [Elaeis guineensis]